MAKCDVVIIGAGPYGLAAAAHLRKVKGLEVCVFGEPMVFWQQNMPKGMLLRSSWSATQIADPDCAWTLEAFQAVTNNVFSAPVPVECFIQYGRWYQERAIPDLDHRKVVRVEPHVKGFAVTLADGEEVLATRVVIACGIGPFAWRPREFDFLPSALASHTSEHHDFSKFTGKRVVVIGGGQSALESAALLHECGAEVQIITRSSRIHWLQGWLSKTLHRRLGRVTNRLLYAPTDVGPAGISQIVARPDLLRRLPRHLQNRLWKRATRPAGARWLVARLDGVPIRMSRSVTGVTEKHGQVDLKLSDGTVCSADHVLLGTGFKVDIAKYNLLPAKVLESVQRTGGYPVLREGLETSLAGLHILGAPAAMTFGPLMQFVSGARYASQSLTRRIAGNNLARMIAQDDAIGSGHNLNVQEL
jgi:cation diffusion facilitator CzcD-associated flavoprotein CzcO